MTLFLLHQFGYEKYNKNKNTNSELLVWNDYKLFYLSNLQNIIICFC